ncbi:DUF3987 domain-containing protein [Xanthomarina sp. F1114]|uniref:DUF3987 domain-containing protein n=1 Tax=Xanthomarina sp. F1114 TaxID=2996019 RepID=UPI00225E35D4|nr:DUF3987 domain-containing protein [Xanthomarina sp. F1114]MCX7546736.1 DUF3987 domain-containing protein [Xanthomarina sp. F1114]
MMKTTAIQVQKNNSTLSNIIDAEFSSDLNFPTGIFPEAIQELIKDAYKTIGYNPDFLSTGILSICATAIGNTTNLFNGSYSSQPILWLAIIGRQGIGKTHPLNFSKQPIEQKDKQNYKIFQELINTYEDQEKKGSKPKYVNSILTDFTPEKLAEALQNNEKGILIFKDELIGWINSFDQYKKGGDQQKYLEFFNGGTLTVDRVSKDPIRVEKTNVNILGGLQPKKLKELAGNGRNDDGFLSRMLFVYPTNLKPDLFTGESIHQSHVDNYNSFINNLYNAPALTLKTTDSQIKIYKDWQHKKIKECFNDDLETSIQAKLQTYVWRLVLVIEMMQQATINNFTETISDTSIIKAIKLIEYFRNNALSVNDRILSTNPLEDLPTNKIDLFNKLPLEFKRSDVLHLFEDYEIKGGAIGRFLNNKSLFIRVNSKGNYKKKFT